MLDVVVSFFKFQANFETTFFFLVGTDIRKAIADGCPAENIIGLDLHQGK